MATLTRPQRFAGRGDTAADWQGWEQQYWEYYNASLDNPGFPSLTTLRTSAGARIAQGSAPLLLLSYR